MTEIVIRDYLLDDEIDLLDAWSTPGIEDTHYSAGVDSRTKLRERHGAAAVKEKERAAVAAFTALSKAGGLGSSVQPRLLERIAHARSIIGPDWRKSMPGAMTETEAVVEAMTDEPAEGV